MNRFPPLTVSQITQRLHVDVEAGVCVWRDATKHHRRLVGCEAGYRRKQGHTEKLYWVIKINGIPYKRAQIILTVATGKWPIDMVDHIDGDSLNDRGENLRHATATQNAWNHKSRAKKADTPMGVRRLNSGRFQARIAVNKQQKIIGVFETVQAAEKAYQQARKENYGAFC